MPHNFSHFDLLVKAKSENFWANSGKRIAAVASQPLPDRCFRGCLPAMGWTPSVINIPLESPANDIALPAFDIAVCDVKDSLSYLANPILRFDAGGRA